MKPHEFWSCTYREAKLYAESIRKQLTDDKKEQIILFEALGTKLVAGTNFKKSKNINLITDTFKNLFKEELEEQQVNKVQSFEEQIRIMRSWK